MCGIAGLMTRDGSAAPLPILEKLQAALAHRGPDGHRIRVHGGCGLVHTRLSIVDVAGGAQPLVAPDDVAHINLHATGTPYNDAIETKAVHAVFGARGAEIPVCSVKSSIGHCMGAAGIIESIAAVKTLSENCIPPILGLEAEHKDPECGLNTPLGGPLHGDFPVILKTSYGFGGTNAAIVLSRA